MSVYQLKDGRWVCGYPKGRDPERPTSTTKYFGRGDDARRAAETFNSSLGLNKNSQPKLDSPRFVQLVNGYMTAKEYTMAPSTWENLRGKMDDIILPLIGAEMANRLTSDVLDRYVSTRAKQVKLVTVHGELTYIRAVLKWACDRRLISAYPAVGFKFPRRDDARIHPPTKAEFDAILTCAVPHMKRAMLISYYIGLRPGKEELLRLTWEDVDLISKTLTVTSALKGGLPKRVVPLNEIIYDHLQQWYEEDMEQGMRYLIHYHGGPIDSLKTAWKAAKKRAKVTRRMRMYDLRHAFATYLLDHGADLKAVSEILGHSSTDMTTRVYQHVSSDLKRKAVKLFE